MPEGPEIRWLTTELDQALRGVKIIGGDVRRALTVRNVDQFMEWTKSNAVIQRVYNKGKYVLMEDTRGRVLLSHCKMTGWWQLSWDDRVLKELDHPMSSDLDKYGKVFLLTEKGRAAFTDPRGMGHLQLYKSKQELSDSGVFDTIGPFVMDEEFNLSVLQRALSLDGKMELADFLLKQNHFSGIGNYLRCEIMFRGKLSPFMKVSRIEEKKLEGELLRIIKTCCHEALSDSLALKVYGKVGELCDVCKNILIRKEHKSRGLFYCGVCQNER